MSRTQSVHFSGVRNTLRHRESIFQPRIVLVSDSLPSAKCFFIEMMEFLVMSSPFCIGLVMASSARGTECMSLSLFSPISTPAWNMSSMKLSDTMSCGGSATANFPAASYFILLSE